MKRLGMLFAGLAIILSGCIIVPDHDHDGHRGYERHDHDGNRDHDRDHDDHHGDHDDYRH